MNSYAVSKISPVNKRFSPKIKPATPVRSLGPTVVFNSPNGDDWPGRGAARAKIEPTDSSS